MKSFKIVNDDIVIDGQNDIAMIEGTDEAAQCIERILSTNIREWFLNIYHGLDYSSIQGKGKDIEGIKLSISEAIYQEARVDEIVDIDVNIENSTRELNINFRVKLINGDMVGGGEVMEI